MNLGIVDLDTSHPAAWIPIEREMGHSIAGVWDGGSVHPRSYVEAFAREHQIARIYDSLPEMARDVDAAIIHGCDWDTHIAKARPFVEASKAVLIDKPFAGNVPDLRQIADWVRQGARITGGSAMRYCAELRAWQNRPVGQRGTPHTAFCGCGVDDFNYGVHAYSFINEILGSGIQSARHLGSGVQQRIQLNWGDGRMGFLAVGRQEAWIPYYAAVVTEKTVLQLSPDINQLYRALLEACLPYLAGEAKGPPPASGLLLEPEWAALAARQSREEGGREIFLGELKETVRFDGAEFAAGYRKVKYP